MDFGAKLRIGLGLRENYNQPTSIKQHIHDTPLQISQLSAILLRIKYAVYVRASKSANDKPPK